MSKTKSSAVAATDKEVAATPLQTDQTDQTGQSGQTGLAAHPDKKAKAPTATNESKAGKTSPKIPARATAKPFTKASATPLADDFFSSIKRSKKREPASLALSPLPFLLIQAMSALGDAETKQLLADITSYFPVSILNGECVGHNPTPAIPIGGALIYQERSRPMPTGFRKLDVPATEELGPFVVAIKEAFDDIQRHYPLRAAALYLRTLCRIWVGLVEENKLEVLHSDTFIREYLTGLLQVEVIASRCQDCAYVEGGSR